MVDFEMLLGYIAAVHTYFEDTNQREHPLKLEAEFILEKAGYTDTVYCVYCGDATDTAEEAARESHVECRQEEED